MPYWDVIKSKLLSHIITKEFRVQSSLVSISYSFMLKRTLVNTCWTPWHEVMISEFYYECSILVALGQTTLSLITVLLLYTSILYKNCWCMDKFYWINIKTWLLHHYWHKNFRCGKRNLKEKIIDHDFILVATIFKSSRCK